MHFVGDVSANSTQQDTLESKLCSVTLTLVGMPLQRHYTSGTQNHIMAKQAYLDGHAGAVEALGKQHLLATQAMKGRRKLQLQHTSQLDAASLPMMTADAGRSRAMTG